MSEINKGDDSKSESPHESSHANGCESPHEGAHESPHESPHAGDGRIDLASISSYSKSGPRYTSYPTAVEFKETTEARYLEVLALHDEHYHDVPLSLYLHLPFCSSACYFCGCSVIYTTNESKKARYIGYIKKELDLLKKSMDTSRPIIHLHFGGGTPTYFDAKDLDVIIQMIYDTFTNFLPSAEISCEIDPRHFTKEQMRVLASHGFNRVSFGVQDFDEEVQGAINRFQSYALVEDCVKIARDAGINSINFDLIYGLPLQSREKFAKTLEMVVRLNPDRLAVFNYAHVPWVKKSMNKINIKDLPSPEEKLEIFEYTLGFLKAHGYMMIGMDHFAKKSDELARFALDHKLRRNFQGYTTKGFSQSIGIGLTSIGEGVNYYIQNHKDMQGYESALDSGHLPVVKGVFLSSDDILRKEVIMNLMNNFYLDFSTIEAKYNIDFKEYFKDALDELEEFFQKGYLLQEGSTIYTSELGKFLIRNIAMPFDAYYKQIGDSTKTFSKTI